MSKILKVLRDHDKTLQPPPGYGIGALEQLGSWLGRKPSVVESPSGGQETLTGTYGALPFMMGLLKGVPHPGQSAEEIVQPGLISDVMLPGGAAFAKRAVQSGIQSALGSPSTIRHFVGPGSSKANLTKLDEAMRAEAGGAAPKSIWENYGWFKAPWDQKWRTWNPHDVSFSKAVKTFVDKNNFYSGKIFDVIKNWDIFDEYPQLKNIDVTFRINPKIARGNASGFYQPPNFDYLIPGKIELEGRSLNDIKSSFYHELQHAIQNIEGFTGGTSRKSSEVMKRVEGKSNINEALYQAYLRKGGEAEARLSEFLMGETLPDLMSAQQIPYEYMDVPLAELWK